jgi:hypothetical protein
MERIMKNITLLLSFAVAACTSTAFTPIRPTATATATENSEVLPEPAADVLFVIDDSGSMEEEQFNLMSNLSRFIETLQATGVQLRFATITTNTKGADNIEGNFFTHPINGSGQLTPNRDTQDRDGVIRDIPDAFCDEVLARSQNGVLDIESAQLQALLSENNIAGDLDPNLPGIQILDFMGRVPGTLFIDSDNDPTHRPELPNQATTATFVDEVGCILAVGVSGSGFEAGLCKVAASLDKDSLSGNNAAFLTNPDSVLAVIMVGDEDDCTLGVSVEEGSVHCEVPAEDAAALEVGSLLCSQPSSENICGTGVTGLSDLLVSTNTFVDSLKAVRSDDQLFVASITGPPTIPVASCGAVKEVLPSCEASTTGKASPGNRFLSFTSEFINTVDSFSETQEDTEQHLAQGICGNFDNALGQIALRLTAIIDPFCNLNAPIDIANFDTERDMRIVIDLAEAGLTCDAIVVDTSISEGASGASDGELVTEALNAEKSLCLVRRDPADDVRFLRLDTAPNCFVDLRLEFLDFALPNHSKATIEYVSDPH